MRIVNALSSPEMMSQRRQQRPWTRKNSLRRVRRRSESAGLGSGEVSKTKEPREAWSGLYGPKPTHAEPDASCACALRYARFPPAPRIVICCFRCRGYSEPRSQPRSSGGDEHHDSGEISIAYSFPELRIRRRRYQELRFSSSRNRLSHSSTAILAGSRYRLG